MWDAARGNSRRSPPGAARPLAGSRGAGGPQGVGRCRPIRRGELFRPCPMGQWGVSQVRGKTRQKHTGTPGLLG